PYKGLRAFQEADAADFFGRESLVDQLVARLSEKGAPRFLAIVGPSGSGKSSVVKAGLLPRVRSGAVNGSRRWVVAQTGPGDECIRGTRKRAATRRSESAGQLAEPTPGR